jgi:hypothetical protein
MVDGSQPIRIPVTRCSWHLVWVLAMLEGLTVPWVVLCSTLDIQGATAKTLSQNDHGQPGPSRGTAAATGSAIGSKTLWLGFVVGFVGVWLLLQLVNRVLARGLVVLIDSQRVLWISPGRAGLWGGVILSVLFALQGRLFAWLNLPYPLDHVIAGFGCTVGSLALSSAVYTWVVRRLPGLAIRIRTGNRLLELTDPPLAILPLLGGLYEAVALPVISTWMFCQAGAVLFSVASGISGGVLGGGLVCLVAHRLRCPLGCFRFREAPVARSS